MDVHESQLLILTEHFFMCLTKKQHRRRKTNYLFSIYNYIPIRLLQLQNVFPKK